MGSTHAPCGRASPDFGLGRLASRGVRPFAFLALVAISRQSLLPPAWAVRSARAARWAAVHPQGVLCWGVAWTAYTPPPLGGHFSHVLCTDHWVGQAAPPPKQEQVEVLAKNCPSLTSTNLNRCDNITDAGIVVLARNCTSLKYVNLENCPYITDVSLEALAKKCLSLTNIGLFYCRGCTDEGVQTLVKSCSSLTHIDLSCCCQIIDSGIESLAYNCPSLKGICTIARSQMRASKPWPRTVHHWET
jgi:hypothetical protein